ncbi:putative transport system permease protein [Staphylococcus piscifermentans]|uniref:Membrane protein n=1 Tax=Staphylococcus piscifermentans TaxID=70258 RepID=A0A239TW18_9STAP|nr:YeeE/YedE family protein [Staphylococcus piscifermentans]RTX85429.1 YeeE/YedE family protein [Staphylococcus piscifermentans]GEP84649.1 membrane protein [Staphylococcus piscifermentans]SNV01318.1 putative transport system permease protein [Staphylococcus piscifermentans]
MLWMIISGLLVGSLLGFVMQRTRFCLAGGFRDMYVQKNNKMFYALLIAISVQAIGLLVFTAIIGKPLDNGTFPIAGTIVGSFIFGVGIVLAGGCATGTYYRAGEGLIGSWLALFSYAVFSAITKAGVLKPVMEKLNSKTNVNADMSTSTGIPAWIWVIAIVAITGYLVVRTLRKPKPKIAVPKLKQRYTGGRHFFFEKKFHPFIAAIAVGLIALLAWPMSYSTGREGGLGITTPSSNLVQFILSGKTSFLDWGVFLVLGIFIGSYIAAKGSREFAWRLPDKKTLRNSVIGGAFMGFGASVAGGCSIGNGLVATAALSWQGWIALAAMILGTWFMSYFLFVKPMKAAQKSSHQNAARPAAQS